MFAFVTVSFLQRKICPVALTKCHCFTGIKKPLSWDAHPSPTKKKTATNQQCTPTLFGPIFLMFQQGLICWPKCLVPLTAKVTESTTHCADSKQGIWGMALKQWLSPRPFCLQMLWNLSPPELPLCCSPTLTEKCVSRVSRPPFCMCRLDFILLTSLSFDWPLRDPPFLPKDHED